MSFGNRSNFCSLKEAFPDIQRPHEKIINAPLPATHISPVDPANEYAHATRAVGVPAVPFVGTAVPFVGTAVPSVGTAVPSVGTAVEHFEPCEQCEYRKKYGHVSTGFNEMLNLLLLLLLLYIVIYKPKI
jgi:hypothetical protein